MGDRVDEAETLETVPLLMDQKKGGEIWIETKKLWRIVGPAIFTRVSTNLIAVVSQAFAGHLGELELAAISIIINVLIGFTFSLLLGMASALETLCGQAFGAKKYEMLGVYMQRSWIVLFLCSILLLPMYFFVSPILKFLGQPDNVAELSGTIAIWVIPLHFALAIILPINRFLQCQLKNKAEGLRPVMVSRTMGGFTINIIDTPGLVEAGYVNHQALDLITNPQHGGVTLIVHIFVCWLVVYGLKLGVIGTITTVSVSWWLNVFILFTYITCGGCPLTWTGFSIEAFTGLWEFTKLSASSGIMICLEYWYYRILIVMTGNLENTKIAVDALSICMSINGLEMMVPLAFFAGAGVRVANELGAGNGKGAKFSMIISVTQSIIIGIIFSVLIMFFIDQISWIFTSSETVVKAVNDLSVLLAFTILLNNLFYPALRLVPVGNHLWRM